MRTRMTRRVPPTDTTPSSQATAVKPGFGRPPPTGAGDGGAAAVRSSVTGRVAPSSPVTSSTASASPDAGALARTSTPHVAWGASVRRTHASASTENAPAPGPLTPTAVTVTARSPALRTVIVRANDTAPGAPAPNGAAGWSATRTAPVT